MPRSIRLIIGVVAVSLLVVPGWAPASGQEAEASRDFAGAISSLVDSEQLDLSHIRHEEPLGDATGSFVAASREATPQGIREQVVACDIATDPANPLTFRTREDITQGRGFINDMGSLARGDATAYEERLDGELTDPDIGAAVGDDGSAYRCEVWTKGPGTFHRVGNVALASIPILVRVKARPGSAGDVTPTVFRHEYCVFAVAAASPDPRDPEGGVLFPAVLTDDPTDDPTDGCDPTPGRTPEDDAVFGDHG